MQFPGAQATFAAGAILGSFLFFFSLGYGAGWLRPVFAAPLVLAVAGGRDCSCHGRDRAKPDRRCLMAQASHVCPEEARMYLPEHFKEVSESEIASVVAAAPLACIVAQTVVGLIANHLPLLTARRSPGRSRPPARAVAVATEPVGARRRPLSGSARYTPSLRESARCARALIGHILGVIELHSSSGISSPPLGLPRHERANTRQKTHKLQA